MAGHWSGDAVCPKGAKRGGGKKGGSKSPKSSGSHNSVGKGDGKAAKPRVVYFSMSDDSPQGTKDGKAYMVVKQEERGGRCIPPPTSLEQAGTPASSPESPTTSRPVPTSLNLSSALAPASTSMSAPSASGFASTSMSAPSASGFASTSLSAPSASGFATTSMSAPIMAPGSASTSLMASSASGSALASLGKAPSEAMVVSSTSLTREMASMGSMAPGFHGAGATSIPRGLGVEHGVTLEEKDFMMIKEALGGGPMPEQGQLQAAMEALSWMEVDSDGGELSPQRAEEEGQLAPAMAFGSKERHEYLDEYLRRYENPDDPEWREVHNERWTEFYPGHPMFIGEDLKDIKRWNDRARQGLPILPGHAGSTSPQPHQLQPQLQPGSKSTLPASAPNQPDSSQPLPTSTTTSGTCQHLKTSRRGTNRHIDMLTCLDCGVVLKREKKEVTAGGITTAATSATGADCKCHNVTWKGTNGFRWKKTCLDCGRAMVGTKDNYVATGSSKTGASSRMSSAVGLTFTPDELADVFNTCMVVAKVKALELRDQRVSVDGLHKILDAVLMSRSSGVQLQEGLPSQQAGGPVTTPGGGHPKDGKLMTFGAYKGKPFSYARMDGDYVKWCQDQTDPSRPMKEFLEYVNSRDRVAYVAEQGYAGEEVQHVAPEDHLIAVLDLGCNKTCHGDRWLQRYCTASGRPLDQLYLLYLKEEEASKALEATSQQVALATWMFPLSWMKSLVLQLVIFAVWSYVAVMLPFCFPSRISGTLVCWWS